MPGRVELRGGGVKARLERLQLSTARRSPNCRRRLRLCAASTVCCSSVVPLLPDVPGSTRVRAKRSEPSSGVMAASGQTRAALRRARSLRWRRARRGCRPRSGRWPRRLGEGSIQRRAQPGVHRLDNLGPGDLGQERRAGFHADGQGATRRLRAMDDEAAQPVTMDRAALERARHPRPHMLMGRVHIVVKGPLAPPEQRLDGVRVHPVRIQPRNEDLGTKRVADECRDKTRIESRRRACRWIPRMAGGAVTT